MLVPGFMLHIRQWNERVKECLNRASLTGHPTKGLKNYTLEDQKDFGIPQPSLCPAFGVRLTLSLVLHGSTAPATQLGRVIYPWFTAIQSDHETLEMPGQHSWSEVSNLYCDLEAPFIGVTGNSITQDKPPYRFPAAIKLDSVSPLLDELVGR